MIGVTHIIAGLDPDGAERMLHRLVLGMDSSRFENEVISLTDLGPMAESVLAGRGATFLPATTQGCSMRKTETPCFGSAVASATRSGASAPRP